jgi:hypothetical protein
VSAKVSGRTAEPFVLPGDDRFTLDDEAAISWSSIRATVEAEQRRLSGVIGEIEAGKAASSLSGAERFSLILGITCHAAYHAGQIQ